MITRSFDVPAALLFRIWAQREHMLRWEQLAAFEAPANAALA